MSAHQPHFCPWVQDTRDHSHCSTEIPNLEWCQLSCCLLWRTDVNYHAFTEPERGHFHQSAFSKVLEKNVAIIQIYVKYIPETPFINGSHIVTVYFFNFIPNFNSTLQAPCVKNVISNVKGIRPYRWCWVFLVLIVHQVWSQLLWKSWLTRTRTISLISFRRKSHSVLC